jgi:hypothetical protein
MEFFLGAFTAEWEQRKAAFLHDLTLGRRTPPEQDERRRRAGGVAPGGSAGMAKPSGLRIQTRPESPRYSVQRRADRPMRARFANLASGSQPAMVKLASFGGESRLGAMVNYVSRNGAVVVENERGDELRGRDQLSAVGEEWDHLMKHRAESRDIGLFKMSIVNDGPIDDDLFSRARGILKHGLGDRAFVFGVIERADGGGYDIDGVTILRNSDGERLTADDRAAAIVQARMGRAAADAALRFAGYGNGTDYGTRQVRSLVAVHKGAVQDEQGRTIADAVRAGDLVQLEWRPRLHSRKPRDVMHLILSARAGTDAAAFQNAARDFMGQQFAGHRYVFTLHDAKSDPKAEAEGGKRPHVHIHAIVAMRSDAGDQVETTIQAFRQWRLRMAEMARSHGIKMEMTDRRDRASAPAYSKNQVRPVNTIGRTQHEGTSAAASRRYAAKRDDLRSYSATARSQLHMRKAAEAWMRAIDTDEPKERRFFIQSQISRLGDHRTTIDSRDTLKIGSANSGSQSRTYLVRLAELVFKGDDMHRMTRAEFEDYEKCVEIALFQAGKTMPPEVLKDFEAIAQAARQHVNARREIVDLLEERMAAGMSRQISRRPASDGPPNDKQRWNDAVARYGLPAAGAANKALLDIELTREAIGRVKEGLPDEVTALKKQLESYVRRAGELALSGNGLIREIAKIDHELNVALRALERDREKAENKTCKPAQLDETASMDHAAPHLMEGRAGSENREAQTQKNSVDASLRQETGDPTTSDPSKQHLHRFEEIQRGTDDRN